jgi:DNA-binding NarL/FixJ family response regulator
LTGFLQDGTEVKILIADDHALFRAGMGHVLGELADSVVMLEAATCENAMQLAAGNPDLDLVLLDLNMPGADGFAALELFSSRFPALPVVILSASKQRSDMQRALDAGALGFIPKETTSEIMLNALRLIMSGGIYVPPELALSEASSVNNVINHGLDFTPRQLETLALLVKGHPNKEIARYLNLAEATVKMHVTAIFKSLGVSNRTQAVLAAEKLALKLPEIQYQTVKNSSPP